MKRVLISKHENECQLLLQSDVANRFDFECNAFISFEAVNFIVEEEFDVILFGSVRAVDYYLEKYTIPEKCEIACVGLTTSKRLKELGLKVSFEPISASLDLAVEDFKTWLDQKRVLAPSSDRSLKSFTRGLNANQVIDKIIYRTKLQTKEIRPCDIYFFTSPSNVEGFIQTNKISAHASVYAWGESTRKALTEIGQSSITLDAPSLEEVLTILKG